MATRGSSCKPQQRSWVAQVQRDGSERRALLKMKDELSPTMVRALTLATECEGKLFRAPGGFWRAREAGDYPSFGTSTVEALVTRGKMKYTRWQERSGRGHRAPFPIEATVC